MNWFAPVDIYCERVGPGFWAEPTNALTNLAFLLAAAAAGVEARRRNDVPVFLLALVVAVVGIGSFLFHTFANRWSSLADVIPIAIFIHAYVLLAMRRHLGLGWLGSAAGFALFLAASYVVVRLLPPGFLNGSGGYVPAWGALLVVGLLLLVRHRPGGPGVLLAFGIFTVSLGFRASDMAVCPDVPLGTHFVWHVLNAVTLYVLLRTALAAPKRLLRRWTAIAAKGST